MHITTKITAAVVVIGGLSIASSAYACGGPCPVDPPKGGDILSQVLNNAMTQGQSQGQGQGQSQTAASNAVANGGKSTSIAKGGAGGKATSTAHGGAGGSSIATGGNQQQAATASTGDVNVSNTNYTQPGAATAFAAGIDGSSGYCDSGGGFSAGVQTPLWGVSATRRKADKFCQMVIVGGQRGGVAYLAHADATARAALVSIGLVEDRSK